MTAYAVDAEQIAAASAQACTTASTIRTEVDTMMAQLLALQDSWTGGAQVNFQATITQWQSIQAQTHDALDAISSQMQVAAATYADAETHSASLFAGV